MERSSLVTAAQPHGIYTRFPISPYVGGYTQPAPLIIMPKRHAQLKEYSIGPSK